MTDAGHTPLQILGIWMRHPATATSAFFPSTASTRS